ADGRSGSRASSRGAQLARIEQDLRNPAGGGPGIPARSRAWPGGCWRALTMMTYDPPLPPAPGKEAERLMAQPDPTPAKSYPPLAEPTFGWTRDGVTPHRPTWREVVREWLDAVDVTKGLSRLIPFTTTVFYLGTAIAALAWLARGPSAAGVAAVIFGVFI